MVPATSVYAVAGINAGKDYHQQVKALGRSHGLGSPHLHVWASLVVTAKTDKALTEPQRTQISEHADSVTDPKDIETLVVACNMKPAYNTEFVRMQLKVHAEAEPLTAILECALQKAGGEQKHGIAPRGPKERKVVELLELMGVKHTPVTSES